MNILKVALLQIAPEGSLENNMKKGAEYCREAKKMGADIALFPEMFSNGYDIYDRPEAEWTADAIGEDSAFVCEFGRLACELDMAIAITFLKKGTERPENSMVLFDRRGGKVLSYSKVHTPAISAPKRHLPRAMGSV